jgi:hypothetical protein
MGRTENLKPWPKGVSGNPGGRPKKKPITEAYEAAITRSLPERLRKVKLDRNEIELPEGATFADLIALGQCRAAAKGITAAAEAIADRLEGKVSQQVDMSGTVDLALRINQARARVGKPPISAAAALQDRSVAEALPVPARDGHKDSGSG